MKLIKTLTPEQIDEHLPQTQCGLCGYGGCMPYAEALVFEKAPINLCPPGGLTTLNKLGELLDQDTSPFQNEMAAKAKPAMVAVIREDECIGCTKCIQACPVDAILGTGKAMHTVITSECTGCELCVAPCPVDCIDMIIVQNPPERLAKQKSILARQRFQARSKRLAKEKLDKQVNKLKQEVDAKKQYVQAALARAKNKKPII